jgi:hypothetical protein
MIAQPDTGPSWAWYLLAGVLLLGSLVAVPAGFIVMLVREDASAVRFTVPGEKQFTIAKPGRYILWNEHETIFNSRTYSSGQKLPDGMRIELIDIAADEALPMQPDLSTTEKRGATERSSIGSFQIERAGDYRFVVEGDFAERIFFFRESLLKLFMPRVARLLAISLLGILASAVIALAVFIRRRSARLAPYVPA